jgi:hypothetical protein
MALTKEDLQSIQELLLVEREHTGKMIDDKISQSEKRIIARMEEGHNRLENLINIATKDASRTEKRLEEHLQRPHVYTV